ncbi:N-acetylmuramic acid 6-phosphate etherase [Pseudactinotalea sp.]|uniref:N-acetylmuramic acid 6-phosphate etherase n=1 Tax=Pseudactinotalea sp. TaxID=1926260 RepID=UPI003B3B6845
MTDDASHRDLRAAAHSVILAAFDGTAMPDWIRDADGLGGVCLFAQNTPDPAAAAQLVAELRTAHPGLVVTIDEEGGDVTRLEAATGSSLPGASALGVLDDGAASRAVGHALGGLLAACDIDVALSPVVDVASNSENVMLAARAIAADPQVVARQASTFIEGLHTAGVAACAKHAPGHGDTAVDSHLGVPVLEVDRDTLQDRELVPFRAAIAAGVDAIMLAHLVVPALSENLTSLDPIVPALLREAGFEGALVTDALDMGAVLERTGGDLGEAAVLALLAGADLLCLGSPAHIDEATFTHVVASIEAAVGNGRLPRARIDDAGARAAALRRRPSEAASIEAALAELARVGADVTRRAATHRGDVTLRPGDGLLDLRFRAAYAASSTHGIAPALLTETLGLVPGEPEGHRVAVLTKDTTPEVADLLARRDDAVVIHVGFPDAAPDATNLVVVHSGGRASVAEAARRCLPDGGGPAWQSLVALRAPTEERNPRTTELDTLDSAGLVGAVLAEDATVAGSVAAQADSLARLVDLGVAALGAGGRVHYVGAGTSGRLGALDAAELLPTYGIGPEGFVAHLAGGPPAMLRAVEGAEDDAEAGASAVAGIGEHDLVIGVAASGRTPYVGGAIAAARGAGAATGLISTNPHATLAPEVDVAVLIDSGPEAVTGSTRMKAGTATKMAINAFSTAVMVRVGKTYGNLMIDVAPTNDKLRARCVRMLMQGTGATAEDASAALAEAGDVRTALVMLGADVGVQAARDALAANPPDPTRPGDPGGVRSAIAEARD